MTRINCVPVECLTDKHLVAEYKEITRPFNKVLNRISKGKDVPVIDGEYRLGTGHETFFFNKLRWLWYRRRRLFLEMLRRCMSPNHSTFNSIQDYLLKSLGKTEFWNDWEPTPKDMYVNMGRLHEKLIEGKA